MPIDLNSLQFLQNQGEYLLWSDIVVMNSDPSLNYLTVEVAEDQSNFRMFVEDHRVEIKHMFNNQFLAERRKMVDMKLE